MSFVAIIPSIVWGCIMVWQYILVLNAAILRVVACTLNLNFPKSFRFATSVNIFTLMMFWLKSAVCVVYWTIMICIFRLVNPDSLNSAGCILMNFLLDRVNTNSMGLNVDGYWMGLKIQKYCMGFIVYSFIVIVMYGELHGFNSYEAPDVIGIWKFNDA